MRKKQILKTPAGRTGSSPLWKVVSCEEREYPLGLTHIEGGIHISVAVEADVCKLLLFPHRYANRKPQEDVQPICIPFPVTGHVGTVWEMSLKGIGFENYDYAFEADGKVFSDPYGKSFTGHEYWGDLLSAGCLLKTPVAYEPFEWEDDENPQIDYEDSVVYCAHVRGLTMHKSSNVSEKGTFAGVAEMIPYLKDLGITTLELLPTAEFQEVIMPEPGNFDPRKNAEPTGKLNYWGYGPAFLYAPKAAYAGCGKNPVNELKKLVKQLHQNGMELVLQLYFTGKEAPAFVLDVLRFWVREYHVDGIHLCGNAPVQELVRDPYLSKTKIWTNSLDGMDLPTDQEKHFGEYNDGFLIDMRRVLKGDAGQMGNLVFRNRRSPQRYGVLNYIAGVNGFTLADMVSYEKKHNEANGEQNQDGSDYNCTWNCGVEGPSDKRKLAELRKQQMRNALLLVFLSQGTPVLLAGDEFGNSQEGNNNAYCQDNEISWLDWDLLEKNKDLYEFTKYLIAFRKAHSVFHMKEEPKLKDYLTCGLPDLSYHGVKAWCPEFDDFRRQMGMMYCGNYGQSADGTVDSHFFVAYNTYGEPRELGLPNLPGNDQWHVLIDSGAAAVNGYYAAGQEKLLVKQKKCMVPARTILVLIAKEPVPDAKEEPASDAKQEEAEKSSSSCKEE
ncbi:MAG: alpha-amylase [Brotaphodocola sp.]